MLLYIYIKHFSRESREIKQKLFFNLIKNQMMKTIFNHISITAVLTLFLISCGSATRTNSDNSGLITSDDTYNEAEILGDIADAPVNHNIDYDKMFQGVKTNDYTALELAAMNENLSIFTNLVKLSVLDFQMEFLDEPITVFIPTNQAFKELPEERFEYLLDSQNRSALRRFIKRHILPQKVSLFQFKNYDIIETASEEEITIDTGIGTSTVYVGGATVTKSDIQASNGIIHIVNNVIEPTTDVIGG